MMDEGNQPMRAHVLLVEDNEINQEVASEFLSGAGLTVDIAANGLIATTMVMRKRYDLVLMDLHMPVMDGLEATREIRRHYAASELPIMAMTASSSAEDRARCLAAGMNDHIAKPIDTGDLLAKARRLLVGETAFPSVAIQTASLPDAGSFLAGVDGLDVASGLKRALNRPALYRRLLEKFVELESAAPQRMIEAMVANDRVTVEREAHTLKGVAAQVGADVVSSLAAEMVDAVRRGDAYEALEAARQRISARLQPLVAAISGALSATGRDTSRALVSFDESALQQICRGLATALSQNDFSSSRLFDEAEVVLRAAFGDAVESLAQEIRNCDYGPALERLHRLMGNRRWPS